MSIQQRTTALFEEQITGWPLLGENWGNLNEAEVRSFAFRGYTISVQFNRKRIVSSAARVDRESVDQRPCFLCRENRPPEEKQVDFGEEYEILCNPFPIFRHHFTVARNLHTPQVIDPEFPRLLDLSRELPDLVLFYNAPSCGASAPDHMHFQAGNLGFMPVEEELDALIRLHGRPVPAHRELLIIAVEDGLRRFFLLEGERKEPLVEAFLHISGFMRPFSPDGEPMLNILSYFRKGKWQVLVFPRNRHRPRQFYQQGERNILLSPAAVDMGGMMITPLEKDFRKIRREDIEDVFRQVVLPENRFRKLAGLLAKRSGP